MLRGESERAVAWAVDCVPGNVRTVIPAEGAPPSPRRTPQPPPHPPHDPPYVHYKAHMTGQRLFLGDMTGAGRRLARKRWPWPNSLRRPGSSPDYDYPLSRAHVDVRPLVLRAALLNLKYSASQPPRTDCPNLVPTSQPRTRAEAYHGLGLQHPTAYIV